MRIPRFDPVLRPFRLWLGLLVLLLTLSLGAQAAAAAGGTGGADAVTVAFPDDAPTGYVRGSGLPLRFTATPDLPAGADILVLARPVNGSQTLDDFSVLIREAPLEIPSKRLDHLPDGPVRLQLILRADGQPVRMTEHRLEVRKATPARITSPQVRFADDSPTYTLGSGRNIALRVGGVDLDRAEVLVSARVGGSIRKVAAFNHTLRGAPWEIAADRLDRLSDGQVRLHLKLRVGRRIVDTAERTIELVRQARSRPEPALPQAAFDHAPSRHIRTVSGDIAFTFSDRLPNGTEVLAVAYAGNQGKAVQAFTHAIDHQPWRIRAARLNDLPAGPIRLQLMLRRNGQTAIAAEHHMNVLDLPPAAGFPKTAPTRHVRGAGSPIALTVAGEMPPGATVEALAWSGSQKRMVEGFSHTLSAPWRIDPDRLDALPDGEARLQVVTRLGDYVVSRTTHTLEISDPPRPEPATVSFSQATPTTYRTGSGVSIGLTVEGEMQPGQSVRVQAWSPTAERFVQEFSFDLAQAPWTISAARLNLLPEGPVQLQALLVSGGTATRHATQMLVVSHPAPTEPIPGDTPTPEDTSDPGSTPDPENTSGEDPADTPGDGSNGGTGDTTDGGTDGSGSGGGSSAETGDGGTGDADAGGESSTETGGSDSGDSSDGGGQVEEPGDAPGIPTTPFLRPSSRGEGWTALEPSADSRIIYVSAEGDDDNDGLTPQTPVRTAKRGYGLLRDGYPDWLLFRSGDVFHEGFGYFSRSGRSVEEKLVIGAYGPGPRPQFATGTGTFIRTYGDAVANHVAFVGLHLYADGRDPGRAGFDPQNLGGRAHGIFWMAHSTDVLLEDLLVEYYTDGLVFQHSTPGEVAHITIRRCIIRNNYSNDSGHAQGIYVNGVHHLTIEDCVFDHNGWNEHVDGADRTIFNHNLYLSYNSRHITVRNCIIARAAAHGLQMRPGGVIEGNLFVRNALAMYTARGPSVVRDNVILQSDDISSTTVRGYGLTVQPCEEAIVEGNIIAHRFSDNPTPGLDVVNESAHAPYVETYEVWLRNNIIHDWPHSSDRPTLLLSADDAIIRENSGNLVDGGWSGGGDPPYIDPNRTVATYMESLGREASLRAFLQEAGNRAAGVWPTELTAEAVNAYIRQGFALRPNWD